VRYERAGECIRFARKNLSEVKDLLLQPTREHGERSGELLREVEVQLGCAAALLHATGKNADPAIIAEIQELKRQTEALAIMFGETNRMLAAWAGRVLVHRNGYTDRGGAAPLFLVSKTTAEG
jgi:hypothetical protein